MFPSLKYGTNAINVRFDFFIMTPFSDTDHHCSLFPSFITERLPRGLVSLPLAYPFLPTMASILFSYTFKNLITPSFKCIKSMITYLPPKTLILPKITSFDMPFDYRISSTINPVCSVGNKIALLADFIMAVDEKKETIHFKNHYFGLAEILLNLWERVEKGEISWSHMRQHIPSDFTTITPSGKTCLLIAKWLQDWPTHFPAHNIDDNKVFGKDFPPDDGFFFTPCAYTPFFYQRYAVKEIKKKLSIGPVIAFISKEFSDIVPYTYNIIDCIANHENGCVLIPDYDAPLFSQRMHVKSTCLSFYKNTSKPWPINCAYPSSLYPKLITTEIIPCKTMTEQAQCIALLMRSFFHRQQSDLGRPLGENTWIRKTPLITLSGAEPKLLEMIDLFLQRWHIKLAYTKDGLTPSYLINIVDVVSKNFDLEACRALAHHPFVRQAYPIVDQMIERFQKAKDFSYEKKLKWLEKVIHRLKDRFFHMEKLCHKNKKEPLHIWIKYHLKAAQALVPIHYWGPKKGLESFLYEYQIALPREKVYFCAQSYRAWFERMSHHFTNHQEGDSRIIVCTRQESAFFQPEYAIHVHTASSVYMPIVPLHLQKKLGLLDQNKGGLEKNIGRPQLYGRKKNIVFSLDTQAGPLPAPFPQWIAQLYRHEKEVTSLQTHPLTFPSLTRISISDLQTWKESPDLFYWKKILKIKASTLTWYQIWGIAVHGLMHHWIEQCPPEQGAPFHELFDCLYTLSASILPPLDWIQRHNVHNLLKSIVGCEVEKRKAFSYRSVSEVSGKKFFYAANGQSIALTARADRIDYLDDGSAHIIDYKTGAVPSFIDLDRLNSLQMPIEGLMVEEGCFGQKATVSALSWWQLSLSQGCCIRTYPRPIAPLIAHYRVKLGKWMNSFMDGSYMPMDTNMEGATKRFD